jgi:hypothetical protein
MRGHDFISFTKNSQGKKAARISKASVQVCKKL